MSVVRKRGVSIVLLFLKFACCAQHCQSYLICEYFFNPLPKTRSRGSLCLLAWLFIRTLKLPTQKLTIMSTVYTDWVKHYYYAIVIFISTYIFLDDRFHDDIIITSTAISR